MKVNPERLRSAREGAGLSRERLARLLDVSSVTVWRYEKGAQNPTADTLGAWATACSVPIESLFEPTTPAAANG